MIMYDRARGFLGPVWFWQRRWVEVILPPENSADGPQRTLGSLLPLFLLDECQVFSTVTQICFSLPSVKDTLVALSRVGDQYPTLGKKHSNRCCLPSFATSRCISQQIFLLPTLNNKGYLKFPKILYIHLLCPQKNNGVC